MMEKFLGKDESIIEVRGEPKAQAFAEDGRVAKLYPRQGKWIVLYFDSDKNETERVVYESQEEAYAIVKERLNLD